MGENGNATRNGRECGNMGLARNFLNAEPSHARADIIDFAPTLSDSLTPAVDTAAIAIHFRPISPYGICPRMSRSVGWSTLPLSPLPL